MSVVCHICMIYVYIIYYIYRHVGLCISDLGKSWCDVFCMVIPYNTFFKGKR
jgi:hypothetical protein